MVEAIAGAAPSHRGFAALQACLRDPKVAAGGCFILFLLILAIGAPWIAPKDPLEQDIILGVTPPFSLPGAQPRPRRRPRQPRRRARPLARHRRSRPRRALSRDLRLARRPHRRLRRLEPRCADRLDARSSR